MTKGKEESWEDALDLTRRRDFVTKPKVDRFQHNCFQNIMLIRTQWLGGIYKVRRGDWYEQRKLEHEHGARGYAERECPRKERDFHQIALRSFMGRVK